MIYEFPADHPFTIKMLRGALITLLGRPQFLDGEVSLRWIWRQDEVTLEYFLKTTLVGQSRLCTNRNHKHDALFRGWQDTKEKPAD